MPLRLAMRLALLTIVVAALIVATDAGRGAQATTEVELDTYRANNSHPIVVTGLVLQDGQHYTITIVGSLSKWFASDWQTYGACDGSTPEDMPVYPSPGTTNGKVGDDAAWHFAGPKGGLSNCSGTFPRARSPLSISLDAGATTSDLVVDDPGTAPDPGHTYHHSVVGQGKAVVFSFDDSKTVDNYGILKFSIEAKPSLTWGDNDCSGAHNPLDALATLVHESQIAGAACPAIGQTLHTASFGDRTWGDLNCSNGFDPPDVLLLLRDAASLPPANLQDCPALGIEIALQPG